MKPYQMMIASTVAWVLTVSATLATPPMGFAEKDHSVGLAPRINVVFLDDAAEGLPTGAEIRRNHWREWNRRIPGFQQLLVTYVARFQRAGQDRADAADSMYALELATDLGPQQRDALLAKELERIFQATGRPSAIIARSTTGRDQLRLVYQDGADYPPADAAVFVRLLGEISPPVAFRRLAESFGPFQPPPTIVFDPRAITPPAAADRAQSRWGLLEDHTYLLPHYLLHALTMLNELTEPSLKTYYSASTPDTEAGTMAAALVDNKQAAQAFAQEFSNKINAKANLVYVEPLARGGYRVEIEGKWFSHAVSNDSELRQYLGGLKGANYVYAFSRTGWDTAATSLVDKKISYTAGVSDANVTGAIKMAHALNVPDVIGLGVGRSTQTFLQKHAEESQGKSFHFADVTGQQNWKQWAGIDGGIKIQQYQPGTTQWVPREAKVGGSFTSSGHLEGGVKFVGDVPIPELRAGGGASTTVHGDVTLQPIKGFSENLLKHAAFGGILLSEGSRYFMDHSGRVRLAGDLAVAAVRSGSGVFDLEGRKMRATRMRMTDQTGEPLVEGFDAVLLLQIDLVGDRHNTLPMAVPRFLATEKDGGRCFGGPWTFEPVLLRTDGSTSQQAPTETSKAWVVPAETGNRLPYAITQAADAGDGAPIRHYDKLQSRFQPDLLKHESGFSWILRHGVQIDLDASGQVQAIREPQGASIRYVRPNGNLAGQEASDGQRIQIDWQDTQPTRLMLTGPASPQQSVVYGYQEGFLTTVSGAGGQMALQYDSAGQLARLAAPGFDLAIARDLGRHLTSFRLGEMSVGVAFIPATKTFQISTEHEPHPEQWQFGPKNRAVGFRNAEKAIWWVWGVDGRVIQMAQGSAEGNADQGGAVRITGTIGVQ